MDQGDDRLRTGAHRLHQVAQHPVAVGAVAQTIRLAAGLQVGAGAEAAAGAPDQDHAAGCVAPLGLEIGQQPVGQRLVQRVEPVRPVERHQFVAVFGFDLKNWIVVHGVLPRPASYAPPTA
jgi:hypothetical protein